MAFHKNKKPVATASLAQVRSPIYKSVRELVMSYFDMYFNSEGELSLRSYSDALDVSIADPENQWLSKTLDYLYLGLMQNE